MTKPGKHPKEQDLPAKAPACFSSQAEWDAYRSMAQCNMRDGFTYCTDCSPKHQKAMVVQARCGFPNIQFKQLGGVIVGRRIKIVVA